MQNFEMPSVLWLSTAVSFFQISNLPSSWNALSLSKELLQATVLSIPLSPNSSPQWRSPSSSFHRLWFLWFLAPSISSGIFPKYHVYFSFFLVFNFCRLLCVILNFFLSKLEWRRILIRLYYWRGVPVYVILCFSNCALRINYKKLLFWLLFNQLNRSLKRKRESA